MRTKQQHTTQRKKLTQLYELRIKKAEFAYQDSLNKQAEAQNAVDERQAAIDSQEAQRQASVDYSNSERVIAQPHLVKNADRRRFWLDYDLEKDRYYLAMDESSLQEAIAESETTKALWLEEQARSQHIQGLLKKRQSKQLSLEEQRLELESEDAFNRGKLS